MKKFLKLCLALTAASLIHAETRDHTFFSTGGSLFRSGSYIRVSGLRDDLTGPCCENGHRGGSLQAVVYGGRTIHRRGSEKLREFFFPQTCNGCCFNFKEFNEGGTLANEGLQDYDRTKDFEARNFNIVTINGADGSPSTPSFSSRTCFNFEESLIGLGFLWRQKLSCKCDGATGLWFEGSLPLENVKNRVQINEHVLNTGGGPLLVDSGLPVTGLDGAPHVANVTQAFAQRNWRFGKIDCKCQVSKWGIADIELKLGYNIAETECCYANWWGGIICPTGTRVRGRTVFEPIVGNNHHFGIEWGSSLAFHIWDSCGWQWNWYFDMASRYLFKNHQVRSFNIYGKPFSRYIETYNSREQAELARNIQPVDSRFSIGTSGINVFTNCVEVRPGFQADLNSAVQLKGRCSCWGIWAVEVGLNLAARQAEVVKLDCCNAVKGVAIKDINGVGQTSTARTIKANYPDSFVALGTAGVGDNGYLSLSNCDLDLNSAAHPAVISHTIYGSVGVDGEGRCKNYFAGLGGGLEFQSREINTALERWTVWAKVGWYY